MPRGLRRLWDGALAPVTLAQSLQRGNTSLRKCESRSQPYVIITPFSLVWCTYWEHDWMLRAGCRALRCSSVNILTAWPGRVAQAPRAGRARALWSCSPCWRPSREPHGSSFQGPATARRQSELDNRAPTGRCHRQPPFGARTREYLTLLASTRLPGEVESEHTRANIGKAY